MQLLLEYTRLLSIIAALAFAVYVLVRSRAGKLWKDERDAERARADRLEKENHSLNVEVAELRVKTNMTDVRKFQQELSQVIRERGEIAQKMLQEMHETTDAMKSIKRTMEKMEQRLDQGLIMGKPRAAD